MKLTNAIIMMGGIAILAVVATTVIVKHSGIKDSYFDPATEKLRQLPNNLIVVRLTHFPKSSAQMRHVHENSESVTRMLGWNVSLRDIFTEAYDCNPARVIFPAGMPDGGFDFLVTTGVDARENLQAAIQKQLGYTTHREARDMNVWILKVADANLPGLTVSADDERPDVSVKDGKLYFKHQSLDSILNGLSRGLNEPVINETGLTNYYDFSVIWNPAIEQKMQTGAFNLGSVKKVLKSWGLRLESGAQPMDVLIVQKAR